MKSKSKIMSILAPVIAILVVAGVWELLVKVMQVSEKLIPAPSAIVASLIENFGDVIAPDLVISIQNILIYQPAFRIVPHPNTPHSGGNYKLYPLPSPPPREGAVRRVG